MALHAKDRWNPDQLSDELIEVYGLIDLFSMWMNCQFSHWICV